MKVPQKVHQQLFITILSTGCMKGTSQHCIQIHIEYLCL
jgi:hypothetical protein